MKNLILVRGVSGAGKSTFANLLYVDGILSADDYFMENGKYKFDGSKLKQAHEWCQKRCSNIMETGLDVAVANTFTQEWEMEPYFKLAKIYDYRIFTVIVENRHKGINIHNVPDEKLQAMKNRFEIVL